MSSLIIPIYNRAAFLPQLFESIEKLTVRPREILLVDNGSSDASFRLCEAFAHCHPSWGIRCLKEMRPGAPRARNTGLQAATSEWVYFFDSDDRLSPDYFERAEAAVERHPDLDLLACVNSFVYPDGKVVRRASVYTSSVEDQILTLQLDTQGMFLRTSFLRSVGGWNPDAHIWNDWELAIRLLHSGARMAWMDCRSYHLIYRHPESITGADFSSSFSKILRTLQLVEQTVADSPIALSALSAHVYLVAGVIAREGESEKACELLAYARRLRPSASPFRRFAFRVLSHYVAAGGRGAWRIARLLLRQSVPACILTDEHEEG